MRVLLIVGLLIVAGMVAGTPALAYSSDADCEEQGGSEEDCDICKVRPFSEMPQCNKPGGPNQT